MIPTYRLATVLIGMSLLGGCEHLRPQTAVSANHIQRPDTADADAIPAPVRNSPPLPAPQPQPREPTHTVVVNDVPVRELLFALARDAELNLDIDADVDGRVTLNAIAQPLPAILERISESNDLTYDIKNDVLRIRMDKPFLRNYKIDYLNLTRRSRGTVNVSTQISATGQGGGTEGGGSSGGDNNSLTAVENASDNSFWETLQANIIAILSDSDTATPESLQRNVLLNRESGIIGVRASRRQHRDVEEFIDTVLNSSQRQVLIEATIAEVKLSDRYQAGIDWNLLKDDLEATVDQSLTDLTLNSLPSFRINLTEQFGNGDVLQTTLSALETFGDVSVMSSPKVMAMNNQTALLKVVDNLVYFTVDVDIESGGENQSRLITYETQVHTVPVGFVMSVTPFISDRGAVTLNVRPTISRVIGQKRDPNPAIAEANVISEIPVIQVREVESVLKVGSGDVAVMGGLMQDEVSKSSRGVPFLGRLPLLGSLFRYQDDLTEKTELVIFIKPVVINHATVTGDLQQYHRFLPAADKSSGGRSR